MIDMTYSLANFNDEPNSLKIGNVWTDKSFGLLKLNMKTKKVVIQLQEKDNYDYDEFMEHY